MRNRLAIRPAELLFERAAASFTRGAAASVQVKQGVTQLKRFVSVIAVFALTALAGSPGFSEQCCSPGTLYELPIDGGDGISVSFLMQIMSGPPPPDAPFPDTDSQIQYETVWAVRPALMAVPHVVAVEGMIDHNDNYIISVEVDSTANLTAVQAQIPPTISGFPVEFGADDRPIHTDPDF